MHTLNHLQEALRQKEQALILYIRYMREAQDSENTQIAALFGDLAKAEEKHITVIRDQVVKLSDNHTLNTYQHINQDISQDSAFADLAARDDLQHTNMAP